MRKAARSFTVGITVILSILFLLTGAAYSNSQSIPLEEFFCCDCIDTPRCLPRNYFKDAHIVPNREKIAHSSIRRADWLSFADGVAHSSKSNSAISILESLKREARIGIPSVNDKRAAVIKLLGDTSNPA